jgi:hypothetical protein
MEAHGYRVRRVIEEPGMVTAIFDSSSRYGAGTMVAPLLVPGVVASVIASSDGSTNRWRVSLTFPGPDARYMPASVSLSKDDVGVFLGALRDARTLLTRMPENVGRTLETHIATIRGIDVTAWAQRAGGSGVRLAAASPTGWKFSRSLSADQLDQWLVLLQDAQHTGDSMGNELRQSPDRRP